jgi:SET domain-containing protein
MLYRSNKIYVEESPLHGRGVFASEQIKAGEILEECHVIITPNGIEYPEILRRHFFSWPKGGEGLVICLGYGSIFNNSTESPNADWETSVSDNKIIFFSRRVIEPGEEILTSYYTEGIFP